MSELPPVVIIAGPTASGKSTLALDAAERFGGEIINADSMQVYAVLSVLTARPSVEDEARVPHHLYGVFSPSEACSAGRWLEMAVDKISDVRSRGKLPIICGGTGLYVKVLREGIAEIPDVPEAVVAEAEALYADVGGAVFAQRLAVLDPVAAAKLVPSDRQRLVRAYGVVMATGRTLAQWHADQSSHPPLDARFFELHLLPERARLYDKIEQRFDQMVERGALDEVKVLRAMQLDPSLPAMKALGVGELMASLAGDLELDMAIDKAKQYTRNLAKRQMTWFRNQGRPDLVFDDFGPAIQKAAIAAISDFLAQ